MPSSVEIFEPDNMKVSSSDFSDLLNDMQARLHAVNTGVQELQQKNKFYIKNTAVLLRNFVVILLKMGPKTAKQLLPFLGIKEEETVKVLDILLSEGKVKKERDIYHLIENDRT